MPEKKNPNVISHEDALNLIRAIVKSKGSQFAAAKHLDISPMYLSDILRGKSDISDNVARKLGYRRVMVFEKDKEPAHG